MYVGHLCRTCAPDHHWADDGLSCQECSATYGAIPIVLACGALFAILSFVHPRTGPKMLEALLHARERITRRVRRLKAEAEAAAQRATPPGLQPLDPYPRERPGTTQAVQDSIYQLTLDA